MKRRKPRLQRCLECDKPVQDPNPDDLCFFCSKDCAARWADDELLYRVYGLGWRTHPDSEKAVRKLLKNS